MLQVMPVMTGLPTLLSGQIWTVMVLLMILIPMPTLTQTAKVKLREVNAC